MFYFESSIMTYKNKKKKTKSIEQSVQIEIYQQQLYGENEKARAELLDRNVARLGEQRENRMGFRIEVCRKIDMSILEGTVER